MKGESSIENVNIPRKYKQLTKDTLQSEKSLVRNKPGEIF